MKSAWKFVLNIGVGDDLHISDAKGVRLANGICAFVSVLAGLSVIINVLLKSWFFITALLVALVFLSLTYYLNYKRFYKLAKINTIVVLTGLILFMSLKGGYGSGLEYYFLSMLTLPIFFFEKNRTIYFFQVIFISCLLVQKYYSIIHKIDTTSLPHMVFYIFNCIGSSVLIILAVVSFRDLTIKNEKDLYEKTLVIEEQNSQLTEANKQLDLFTYSVSHDLKAPLRGIGGYSKLLEDSDRLSKDDLVLLESIKSNVKLMQELIENLLVFSHSVKKELDIKKTNLQEIVEEVLKLYKTDIEEHNVRIILNVLPSINTDGVLMKHVFDNLISNALKYSRKKKEPKVEIGSYSDNLENIYFVKDNGTGFDMKYANKLFIPFQRLHSRNEFEGTGVGLSIVKNIIQRLGGRVWVKAKEGEGAEFYFSLPTQPALIGA